MTLLEMNLARLFKSLTALATVLLVGSTAASAQTLDLPDVTSRIGVGAPFLRCFSETWPQVHGVCPAGAGASIRSLQGKLDVGFMWTYGVDSPRQLGVNVNLGAALKIDRFPGWAQNNPRYPANVPYTESGWQQGHPSWIEYTCAVNSQGVHTTPAWEYGDVPKARSDPAYVPFNVKDPQVRQFFFNTYVKPSLDAGYRMIVFDNVNMRRNNWDRCGHYDDQGRWVQDYSGTPYDPTYESDMLSWLQWLRDAIHAYAPGALLALNYDAAYAQDPPQLYQQVFNIADLVWEEGGFTDWGAGDLSGKQWLAQFEVMRYLASQPDKGLLINGIEGGHTNTNPAAITAAQRQWVIANYLLVKGAHTYTTITPNAYGSFYEYPEYSLPIGSPSGGPYASQNVWLRRFTGGMALVNPSTASQTINVPAGYFTTTGASASGSLTLKPVSGVVLLTRPDFSRRAASASATGGSGSASSVAATVRLTGTAKRQPRLSLSLAAPAGGRISSIAVFAGRDLKFSGDKRRLARYVLVSGGGKKRRFTATMSRGVLRIRLSAAVARIQILVRSPELAASRPLVTTVRRHRAPLQGVILAASGPRVASFLRLAFKPA